MAEFIAPPAVLASSAALDASQQATIITILQRHDVRHAAIFGSFARGTAHSSSDIDLLVEPSPEAGLFALSRLALELEEILGRRIDLVTFRSLHPGLRPSVQRDQITVY